MRRMLIVSITTVLVLSAMTAEATTWYVRQGGGGDAMNIQAGIDLASDGDVVVVGPGTYTGTGNYNIYFNGKNITLVSESGPVQTVIDCQTLGQAFIFVGGETYDAVVEGFKITHGNGMNGGAIYCDGASPTIRYNLFCDNLAFGSGGAVHARNGSPTFYNNTFHGNGSPYGGAIMLGPDSNAQLWQNLICASTSGGAFACASPGAAALVTCNDIVGNAGGDLVTGVNAFNNFSVDPLFCGAEGSGNFYLQKTSPCTSNFSPCAAQVGALGAQCEVTRVDNVTWGHVKNLYR